MQSLLNSWQAQQQRDFSACRAVGFANRAVWQRIAAMAGMCLALVVLSGCEKKKEAPKAGPPEVLVAEVAQQNVPIFQEWVAQLNGPVNADITPKVQGYLLKQNYQNGYFVQEGPAPV